MKKIVLSISLVSAICLAETGNFPSFQGFRGAINTPNAEVLSEGSIEFLYTNQVDDFSPGSQIDFRENKTQDNYFLNIGVLPYTEVGLRYGHGVNETNDSSYLSDRILNAKIQLPIIPSNLAKIAIGMQDIGGGAPHLKSIYGVVSTSYGPFLGSLGYAKGDDIAALDGIFGSIEYKPFSWLQVAAEYDTKEWSGAIKSSYPISIGGYNLKLGAMAKSSIDYNDVYGGIFIKADFLKKYVNSKSNNYKIQKLPNNIEELSKVGFSNVEYQIKGNVVWFSYENTLYGRNDMDALGYVLATLSKVNLAEKIVVTVKKNNVNSFSVLTSSKEYQNFLKRGQAPKFTFFDDLIVPEYKILESNLFKPQITFYPDIKIVDGSEYGDMDYTLALNADASIRVAKGTVISARLNVPISITDNFDNGGVFDYRNRNKTSTSIDQALISYYGKTNIGFPVMVTSQIGRFDNKLDGISLEGAVSDNSGKHMLIGKYSYLEDGLYDQMDLYSDTDIREIKLLTYKYYSDWLNSDIKLTGGEFLYGDEGFSLALKRYFSDVTLQMEISQTDHELRGENKVGKVSISIPLGLKKRFKTSYIDFDFGDFSYERRKTIVSDGETSYAQPLHLKDIDNAYTLENYYLDKGRFNPAYIQNNKSYLKNTLWE